MMDIKIAAIGMGHWGKNLVRVFHELGALAAICDEDPSCALPAREHYPGVPFRSNFQTILDDERINAVALATPASTHFELAKAAINAGKDIFVEKPLALNVAEGEALVELAARNKRIIQVGHVLRYHPAITKLDSLIRNGDLGQLQYLYSNRLNMGRIRTEENILWSFAPHDVSIMLALLGEEPSNITCQGGAYLSRNVPDVTLSQFIFPSGVQAHIFVNWLHPFKEQRLVVIGSKQMAVFDDTADDKLVLYPHRVEWKNRRPMAVKAGGQAVALAGNEPLREECEHFLECIASRRQPLTDGREGLRVLKVLDACQRSLEQDSAAIVAETRPTATGTPAYFAHETACVDGGCAIGTGTKIWHFSHIMSGAELGGDCVVGQNCHIADGVVIGRNVKIQNNVSVYTGTEIEDDVFLGPSCVLTNVTNPRSQINRHALYEKTLLRRGATIGANATIVCGVTVGRYAFVAAGAVVTKDVPDYGLMMGVPAKREGWMSRHGHRLSPPDANGVMTCPESGYRYRLNTSGALRCLDLNEAIALPAGQSIGRQAYTTFASVDAQASGLLPSSIPSTAIPASPPVPTLTETSR